MNARLKLFIKQTRQYIRSRQFVHETEKFINNYLEDRAFMPDKDGKDPLDLGDFEGLTIDTTGEEVK